jgi:TolB-like protein
MSVLPDRVSVAILPFEVGEGDADLAAFSMGLAKVVTDRMNRLGGASGYFVAPVSDVTRHEVRSPEQARIKLGVTLALKSRITVSGTELVGELELVDAKSLKVLGRTEVRETWTDPVQFAEDLGEQVARLLEIDAPPLAERLPMDTIIAASTYRFYLKGLGKLEAAEDSASVAEAISDFKRAISIAPEYAVA